MINTSFIQPALSRKTDMTTAQDQQSHAQAPCPFCGSADTTLEHVGGNSCETFCEHCGASGPSDSEQWRVAKGWNARALPTGMTPEAWRTRYRSEPGMIGYYPWTYTGRQPRQLIAPAYDVEPIYTSAQVQAMLAQDLAQDLALAAQERKPLTDERIREIDDETYFHESPSWPLRFARAIEAELRKASTP